MHLVELCQWLQARALAQTDASGQPPRPEYVVFSVAQRGDKPPQFSQVLCSLGMEAEMVQYARGVETERPAGAGIARVPDIVRSCRRKPWRRAPAAPMRAVRRVSSAVCTRPRRPARSAARRRRDRRPGRSRHRGWQRRRRPAAGRARPASRRERSKSAVLRHQASVQQVVPAGGEVQHPLVERSAPCLSHRRATARYPAPRAPCSPEGVGALPTNISPFSVR